MDKKITPVIVGSPVGSIAIAAAKSQLKPQILVCDPEKPVSFFDPPENELIVENRYILENLPDHHIIGDNQLPNIIGDNQLPMSQRSYGWYNKFSKNNIHKKR